MRIGQAEISIDTLRAYAAEGAVRLAYHPLDDATRDRLRWTYGMRNPSVPVVSFFDVHNQEVGTWTEISPDGVANTTTRGRKWGSPALQRLVYHDLPIEVMAT